MAIPKKSTEPKKTPSVTKSSDSIGDSLREEFAPPDSLDEEEDYDEDDDDILDDDDGFLKKNFKWIIIGGVILVSVIVIIFVITKKDNTPPPAPVQEQPPPEPTTDPRLAEIQSLYEQGIGKEYVDETNLFAQGNIESNKFRRDFSGNDQPENFKLPVKITVVRDGVSYVKHRAVTADGIEIYWLEGEFKGKACMFTIPYSIYQVIQPEGVIDVEVEVVTDANDSQTITSFTAIPPSKVNSKK